MGITNKDVLKTVLKVPQLEEQMESKADEIDVNNKYALLEQQISNGVTDLQIETAINKKVEDGTILSNTYKLNCFNYLSNTMNNGGEYINNTITIPVGFSANGSFVRYFNNDFVFKSDETVVLWFKVNMSNINNLSFNRLLKTTRNGSLISLTHNGLKSIKVNDSTYLFGAIFNIKKYDSNFQLTLELKNTSVVSEQVVVTIQDVYFSIDTNDRILDRTPKKKLFKSTRNYKINTNHSSEYISLVGIDTTTTPCTYYGVHFDKGKFLQKNGVLGTWGTSSKNFPPNVIASGLRKVIRFKEYIYATCKDEIDGRWKVYKATPTTEVNVSLSWVLCYTADEGVTFTLPTVFNCDDVYMYLGEYGDPVGGAKIYRSKDGATWSISRQIDSGLRHIHGVNADPYRVGWVWATSGDGSQTGIFLSKNYGATWEDVVRNYDLKSVQISFTQDYVWLASDAINCSSLFVIDRNTLEVYNGSHNAHHQIAVPYGTDNSFYKIAFLGCADEQNETYYCIANDTSVGGNTYGLFFLNEVGEILTLVNAEIPLRTTGSNFPQVYISEGYVHFGNFYFKTFN